MDKEYPKRTTKQNSSLHKFCQMYADMLNNAGLDQRMVLIGREKDIEYIVYNRFSEIYKFCDPSPTRLDEVADNIIRDVCILMQADIPWTMKAVKDRLWRPIQIAMFGVESTTGINTVEPTEIVKVLNQQMGEKFGAPYVEWPSLR